MENEESSSLIGNSAAPYINGLAAGYGLATQYYAVSHPSLPNYLTLTAGGTCWISSVNHDAKGRLPAREPRTTQARSVSIAISCAR